MGGTGVELNLGVVAFGLFMSVGIALHAGTQLAASDQELGDVDVFNAFDVIVTLVKAFFGWVIPGAPWFIQVPLSVFGLSYWIYMLIAIIQGFIP